jgi:ElaB/YqjD/DUF883 family membrane-anchored ribosome-binding protein
MQTFSQTKAVKTTQESNRFQDLKEIIKEMELILNLGSGLSKKEQNQIKRYVERLLKTVNQAN